MTTSGVWVGGREGCVGAVMTGIIPARFEPLQVALKRNSSFFSLSTSNPFSIP